MKTSTRNIIRILVTTVASALILAAVARHVRTLRRHELRLYEIETRLDNQAHACELHARQLLAVRQSLGMTGTGTEE